MAHLSLSSLQAGPIDFGSEKHFVFVVLNRIAQRWSVRSEVVSAKGNHELALALELFLAVVSCLLALLLFYRAHLFTVPLHFTGDTEDSLIQAARLEHWFGVFRGRYHWRDPIFFYPRKKILG